MKQLQRFALLATLLISANAFAQSRGETNDKAPKSRSHTAGDVLTENTPEDRVYLLRKIRFINDAVESLTDTGVADLNFNLSADQPLPFFLDEQGLKALEPSGNGADWIDDQMRQRSGIPPTVSLNEAIQSLVQQFKRKRKSTESRNLPIPSNMEIDILKILWVEKEATSGEIYASLDTSRVIFAEELQAVLGRMVKRGFLDRKKISPSHDFSLFGIAKIEMSSKNRKNKQYLYWPIVTKKKLFTYLDAKHFLAMASGEKENKASHGNGYSSSYEKMLEKRLYRLFE